MLSTPHGYALLRSVLKSERLRVRLRQSALAKRLGKPQSYIAKIEVGERRLDLLEFIDLCDAIGCSPTRILRTLRSRDLNTLDLFGSDK